MPQTTAPVKASLAKTHPASRRIPWHLLSGGLLAASSLVWTGCGLLRETTAVPGRTVRAVTGSPTAELHPALLQQRLMRYADDAINRSARTWGDYLASATEPAEVALGMQARLVHTRTLVALGAGPNPTVGILDAASMATLTRLSFERNVATLPEGERYQPLLRTTEALEANAWLMLSDLLQPRQEAELREEIEAWFQENCSPNEALFAVPQEFATAIRSRLEARGASDAGSRGLLTVDLMSGLDPAVREVSQARLVAERALFAAQHAPRLLRWEIELLTLQISTQPEMQTLLSNSTSLAASLDRASRTAEALPDRITAEREAILRELEDQEGRLTALSAELRLTLEAGDRMSTSLTTTLATSDALMKRFGVGEPRPERVPNPDARPFDVLDYARTAQEVAAMAGQLQGVLTQLNTTMDSPALEVQLARLDTASQRAAAHVGSLLNHAFLLAAGLILLAAIAVVAVRKCAQRPKV